MFVLIIYIFDEKRFSEIPVGSGAGSKHVDKSYDKILSIVI